MDQETPVHITLVDLAGIERNKVVFDDDFYYQKQFNESKNINLSLSTLLKCFRALRNKELLPYRESTLTKFIFESFVKQMNIILLITFDPWHVHFDDNLWVLEFSQMAKEIKLNTVKRNTTMKDITDWQSLYDQRSTVEQKKFGFYSPYESSFSHRRTEM